MNESPRPTCSQPPDPYCHSAEVPNRADDGRDRPYLPMQLTSWRHPENSGAVAAVQSTHRVKSPSHGTAVQSDKRIIVTERAGQGTKP